MAHDGDHRRSRLEVFWGFTVDAVSLTCVPSPSPTISSAIAESIAIGLAWTPKLSATMAAVSKSICWLMFAMTPFFISSLMMSTVFTSRYSASSLTDRVGGSSTLPSAADRLDSAA
jgi:hypothetical protein